MERKRGREREREKRSKEGRRGRTRGKTQRRVPSWFFECSKNIPSTRGKIKRRPTGMAGDSAGKRERDGKGGCASKEKAKELQWQRRD